MPKSRKVWMDGAGEVGAATADGLTGLLGLAKDATGGVAVVPGVLGALLWIVQTSKQFRSNRVEWQDFAVHVSSLRADIDETLKNVDGELPPTLTSDIVKLQSPLTLITSEMKRMKDRSGVQKFMQTLEDPKRISGFRQLLNDAVATFQIIRLVSIERRAISTEQRVISTEQRIVSLTESMQQFTADSNVSLQMPSQTSYRMKRCPPPTSVFTGRTDILRRMQDYFYRDNGKRHACLLYGLGGAGKTQLAFKFVEQCQMTEPPRFSEVFFVDATTVDTIKGDFKGIALANGLGGSAEEVVSLLVSRREEWLLLLNNADDTTLNLAPFIPQCTHGNILITSRNRDIRQHAPQANYNLSGMCPDDAAELLLELAYPGQDHKDEEQELARAIELGYLALAIVQAGAFLFRTEEFNLTQYLKMYKERQSALLEEYKDYVQKFDDYAWTVHTTWEISFEKLSPEATSFLQICSCMHHEGISQSIFQKAASNSPHNVVTNRSDIALYVGNFLANFRNEAATWCESRFLQMINEIRSYSLIEYNPTNQTYTIHPLVHEWIRKSNSASDLTRARAVRILGMSISWKFRSEDYTFRRGLVPHLKAVLSKHISVPNTFLQRFELAYSENGLFNEAEMMGIKLMKDTKQALGEEHPQALNSIFNLATNYMNQGRWKEAQEMDSMVLEARKRVLGEDHTDTLTSMAHLAANYCDQGRMKEAEELQRTVVEARKRVKDDHTCILTSMAGLASVYQKQGRWKLAEELLVNVMDARKQALGEEHPNTLGSMGDLVIIYTQQGRWKEAEALALVVMERKKQVMGEYHPYTLTGAANLAQIYERQARWKDAEEIQVSVLEARKRVQGEEHPETLKCMNDLAINYYNQGRWKEAERLLIAEVKMTKRLLFADHPDTLRSIGNLASIYGGTGRRDEAEELEITVMEARKRVLCEDHPETLTSVANLASTYRKRGRVSEAEELEVTVMEARTRLLGAEHPDTLVIAGNLASTYRHQGRLNDAEKIEIQVLEARERLLGEEHPHTIFGMSNLALTYGKQCRWKEAEELQIKALELRKRILGDEHPHTLSTAGNLASTYLSQGRLSEAEELQEAVMESTKRVLGEEHPDTLSSINDLAMIYRSKGRWKDAEVLQQLGIA